MALKKRKIIGVLLAQAEREYQSKLMSGIAERAFELGYDCFVFSDPIKAELGENVRRGAENIFDLINFDMLDGVIIVPDTFYNKKTAEFAEQIVRRKFKGAVVSVDHRAGDMPVIMGDDASAIESLTDHLIEKHGCRIIDFFSGAPGHEHSARRLEGYLRSLKKHGIAYEPARVHDGDFWYNMGEKTAEDILSSPLPRPQAVVCACDTQAISLCDAFAHRGIKVPEDIKITGYDRIKAGTNHVPSITSAEIPAKQTGANAVEYLHSVIENKPFEPTSFSADMVLAQTCGCGVDASAAYRSKNFYYSDDNHLSDFLSVSNDMMSDLISAENLNSLIGSVNWYSFQVRPFDALYLCLNQNWEGSEDDYIARGYSENVHLRLAHRTEGDKQEYDISFPSADMLPEMAWQREKPAAFYFAPLHFGDRAFGYIVMQYDTPRSIVEGFCGWLKNVCNGFECMRRQIHIRRMYFELEKAALTDSLTGLYNRYAFNRRVEELIADGERGVKTMFMMADLNYLKLINDNFGHLAGDKALNAIGQAISSACGENERCYRFGGDEFMLIGAGDYSEERIDDLKLRIRSSLEDFNAHSGLPYMVKVSLGAVCEIADSSEKLDRMVKLADEKMYQDKQINKKHSTSPFR